MDELLDQFEFSLRVEGRAVLTRHQYIYSLKAFFNFLAKDPKEATIHDLQRYQVFLIDQKLNPRTVNGKLAAVKYFYLRTLAKDWPADCIPWIKVTRRLPNILSPEEVASIIQSTR